MLVNNAFNFYEYIYIYIIKQLENKIANKHITFQMCEKCNNNFEHNEESS